MRQSQARLLGTAIEALAQLAAELDAALETHLDGDPDERDADLDDKPTTAGPAAPRVPSLVERVGFDRLEEQAAAVVGVLDRLAAVRRALADC